MDFSFPCINSTYLISEINECISSPCIHGTCIDEIARYSCRCDILFIGENCENGNYLLFNVEFFLESFLKVLKLFNELHNYFCLHFSVIASYIVTIAIGALGIIATAVGLFVIWRKKR